MKKTLILACVALLTATTGCKNCSREEEQQSSHLFWSDKQQKLQESGGNLIEVKMPAGVSNQRIDYEAMTVILHCRDVLFAASREI
ncbi:MAG: hypothetical protein II559_00200 [Muribaculaceae bacterium]|nr:hypothetical protein [Muribaculaceae bacterium]MBQ3959766.1 hypothetical protein [Muribaculaceae bacterium]